MRTVLACLLLVAGCTADTPAPSEAPKPPPTPGLAWRTKVPGNGYALVDGTVFAGSQGGVTAVEAKTGRTMWRFESPEGMNVVSWAVTGRAVTVAVDATKVTELDVEADWQTIGLDAATGGRLWDIDREELLPSLDYFAVEGPPVHLAASAGIVITPWYDDNGDSELVGVEARTGAIAWSTSLAELDFAGFSGCLVTVSDLTLEDLPLVVADDTLAAVVARCAQGRVVFGFDPRTGEPKWATPIPPEQPGYLLMDHGVLVVTQFGPGTVLAADGRVVYTGHLPPEQPVMAVVGDTVVVSGMAGTDDPLLGIDLRGGGVRWSLPRPSGDLPTNNLRRNGYRAMTASGDAVLGYRSSPGGTPDGLFLWANLLPVVVDSIDPATGTIRSTPLTVTGLGEWFAVADGTLLALTGNVLNAVPLTAGGAIEHTNAAAPIDRWPDPCELLPAEQLEQWWPGRPPKPVGTPGTLLSQPLPHPIHCSYTDLDGSVPAMITVDWTAADPQDAAALATSAHLASAGLNADVEPKPLVPDIGTWAMRGNGEDSITLHTGTVIVSAYSWDPAVPAVQLAKAVTAELQALGYR
ncbi:outer membrane protein assembly factor BamB [Actinokineospora baliensis]|uniref:outer membrane protein assembly factor BamB family protein n=1 Tax=Actinokineospora baliensis TaxID=547056 RepID=UPI001956BDAD|nr:PQQ-binding-like beta-propeller repeat protein [Actinokineospora baliensis]MBM7773256.1 outer membrane protein assembly factor BamB [Actinokineospora baliensis]